MQRKIDDMFMKLPVREREKIEKEEMREKRRELATIKEELWKYRGREERKNVRIYKKGENQRQILSQSYPSFRIYTWRSSLLCLIDYWGGVRCVGCKL